MADEILNKVGAGWKFLTILFLLCGFNHLLLCVNTVVMVLFHMTPEHHCEVSDPSMLNISIPLAAKQQRRRLPYEPCSAYVDPFNHSEGVQGCDGYTYYTTKNEHTIVNEWDLVCEQRYIPPLSSTLYFVGMTLGSLFFGHVADRFGRKPTIIICVYLQTILGIALYFVQDVISFLALRTLLGAVIQGSTQPSLTLLIELSPAAYRGYAGIWWSLVWAAGVMIMGTLAYFIRQWRTIQLIIAVPAILSCIYSWFLPESIRWLLSRGKIDQAKRSAEKVATWNGVPICNNMDELLERNLKEIQRQDEELRDYNYFHLFKTPEIRKRTFILAYTFFAIAVFYFGILLNTTGLSGDRYLNFLIGNAQEVVVKLIILKIINICKRTDLVVYAGICSATLCIVGVVVKRFVINATAGIISTILILASKAALGATFSASILLQNELFPTVVRNMGQGVCVFGLRVGGILAPPFIAIGQYTDSSIPFIIYAVAVYIAAGLNRLLPETKDAPLPDMIAEIEKKPVQQEEEMKEVRKT